MPDQSEKVKTRALTPQEIAELESCERVIERGLETFIEVGSALLKIRDGGLYQKSHGTFEDYCQERWSIARSTAYQLIDAAKVVENVRHGGHAVPTNERQARPLASLAPEQQREAWTEAVETAPNGKPTGAHVQATVDRIAAERVAREARKLADLVEQAAAAPTELAGRLWEIRQGDCLDELEMIEEGSVRLIFADPPYNIGIEYGDHYDDARPADEFDVWCSEWLARSFRALSDDGSLWLLVNHEWARTLCFRAEDIGFHLRQWITWYESFGVNTTRMFNRCSRPLLWLVKDAGRFVFNAGAAEIRRPSDRQTLYNDPRANPEGKLWDDVWGINPPIPRVVGTAKERLPEFPTQLPLALLRPIVACASDPDDMVVDPFSGSGTTGAACIESGRQFTGIELSERFAELSRLRLAGMEASHAIL